MDYDEILKNVDAYLASVSKEEIQKDLAKSKALYSEGPTIAEYFEGFGDQYEFMDSESPKLQSALAPDAG